MFFNRKIYAWILGSIALLTLSALNMQAMERCTIILAQASILEQRLCVVGLDDFLKKTQLHKILGGKKILPLEVIGAVELALCNYNYNLGNNITMARIMQMQKSTIIRAISEETFNAWRGYCNC
jgi:hypothetical protein